jgi:regulation of enolase protein 1 (concanavalin A-like superfamily)
MIAAGWQQTGAMLSSVADLDPVWLNEPERWRSMGADLLLTTDPGTDFWRQTHYGMVNDSGHHMGVRVTGEFTAKVEVSGQLLEQYDHAGLMVRMDAERWVTCGMELVDGTAMMSTVVTHAVSDWSSSPLGPSPETLGLRLRRSGNALSVEYAVDGGAWVMHRLAYLPPALPVSVGPIAASPRGGGFEVRFRGFDVQVA